MRQESKLLRLTIDTNTVVSATLNPGNYASRLLGAWEEDTFRWIQTPQTLQELTVVLNRERFQKKYGLKPEDIAELLETIAEGTEIVSPLPPDRLLIRSRDPKDDIFLSAAMGGNCDYLITEDKDLLILAGKPELGNLKILSAAGFLSQVLKRLG